MTLGIVFALTSRFAFARHCLCVAAKIATDTEASRSFSCCAAVALLIDDDCLLRKSIEAARRYNPYDADAWQVIAKTGYVSALEGALIAFEFGCPAVMLGNLWKLCLDAERPFEALGFAFMSGANEAISTCLECVGRYDLALVYADCDERRERLHALLGDGDFLSTSELSTRYPTLSGVLSICAS